MKPENETFHHRLVGALEVDDDRDLVGALSEVRAADIAESFELIDDQERSRILFALPPHTAAEVVTMLGDAIRGDVVEELDTESLAEIVSKLRPDDAADMLGELPEEEIDEILDHIPDEVSDKIEELMGYDESTAGGIMTPDIVAVPASATVADAVEYVRGATPEEDLNEVFIVDGDHKLIGTVPLRRMVTNSPATKLTDICDLDPVSVYVNDDQETVVQIIRKYDVSEAAVVDPDGRLVGRITHDDLLDVADEEAEEDLLRLAGTDAAELDTTSVFSAARIRLMWLLPCMVGMMATATVMRISEPKFNIAVFAALAIFVPLIAATGGNAGVQITTVIVRGFATGERASGKLWRVFFREGRIAVALAPTCGLMAWGLVTLFFPMFSRILADAGQVHDPARVAMAVGIAMTTTIMVAALLGIALPFSIRRLGADPALASGPLVTTLNDVVSVSIYMLVGMKIAS